MKNLKIPAIKGPLPSARSLSMDEYIKFINFNLKHTFDKEADAKRRKMAAVNVPFSLK